ncbi:MAG: restriction endonuclease subunit S [Gammaproteobacteria bacterium]|nr:restriction endonuclease subunit S [Gammaproteobacteria bacterium]MDP2348845.1 restriction endonuclease subunit S [Gammaproteobacteria bacterium]
MRTEISNELPSGWEKVRIGELCDLKNGYAFKPADWSRSGLPIIRIQNLNNPDAHFNCYAGELRERFLVENGELLFAWSGTPGTSFGAHIWRGGKAALNQHIFRIDFDESRINKKYFMLAINQKLNSLIERAHGGVGLRHVTKGKFEDTEIEVPPLQQQHRIVAKLETLFSELDKGIESLKTSREQLKVYRQAVLKHAFEGKLTAHWREQYKEKVESPEQLLARIQQEREARYQQQLQDWKCAVDKWEKGGKNGNKPGRPRKSDPEGIEKDCGVSLPTEWASLTLGKLNTDIFDGPFGSNLKSSDYVDAGIRVIRLENIGYSEFIEDKYSYITLEKYRSLERHTVHSGDLVFSSFITDGIRVAILPDTVDLAINKADCFCIRVHGQSVRNDYLAAYLSTRSAYKQVESGIHGVGRPRINTTQLKEFSIPLCSPHEQDQVMLQIEDALSVASHLEVDIDNELERTEILRQSILKKAFSGQLVTQETIDEPHNKLLKITQVEMAGEEKSEVITKQVEKSRPGKEVLQ